MLPASGGITVSQTNMGILILLLFRSPALPTGCWASTLLPCGLLISVTNLEGLALGAGLASGLFFYFQLVAAPTDRQVRAMPLSASRTDQWALLGGQTCAGPILLLPLPWR